MNALFFNYLLPTSIAVALFYGSYYFLLRKGSFFQLNRFFLLFALLFSFVLPFIHINNPAPIQQINYTVITEQVANPASVVATTVSPEKSFDWNVFLKTIYLIGITFMIARLLAQCVHISFLVIRFGIKKENGYNVVRMENNLPHFSFFRLIFINQNKLNLSEESSIIAHERAHLKQCHFIDLLLLEFTIAFQWFNPVMWLYKRSLKSIHEYLADQTVLKSGAGKVNYCQLLVKQTIGFHLESLTNSFYYPSLKTRILMMTKKQNNRRNLLKFCFVLPVFVLLISVFAYGKTEKTPRNSKQKFNSEEYEATPDQSAVYKNGEKDIIIYFLSAFGKDWAPIMVEKTTIQLTFFIDETGKVANVNTRWTYLSANKEIDFQKWASKMEKWKPALKNGKLVKSTYFFDGTNALMAEAKKRGFKIYTVEEYEKKFEEDEEKAWKENPYNTMPDQPAVCKGGEKAIVKSFLSGIDFANWKSKITDQTTIRILLSIDEKGAVKNVGTEFSIIALFSNTEDEFDFNKKFQKMSDWQPAIKDGKPIKSVYIFEGGDILRAELKKRGLKIYTMEDFQENKGAYREEHEKKRDVYKTNPDQFAKYKNGDDDIAAYFLSKLTFDNWKSKITDNSIVQCSFWINESGVVDNVEFKFINQGNYMDEDFRIDFSKMGDWAPALKDGKPIKSLYTFDAGNALRKAMKEKGLKVYTVVEFMKQL